MCPNRPSFKNIKRVAFSQKGLRAKEGSSDVCFDQQSLTWTSWSECMEDFCPCEIQNLNPTQHFQIWILFRGLNKFTLGPIDPVNTVMWYILNQVLICLHSCKRSSLWPTCEIGGWKTSWNRSLLSWARTSPSAKLPRLTFHVFICNYLWITRKKLKIFLQIYKQ